ncbi:MAG: SDR family oxidoreductase [Alkalispirochaeta sp.]
MSDVFSLSGQLCLVTGGGTGIGRAIAESFIAAGARVVITGRRQELLRSVAEELGPQIIPLVQDLSRLETVPGFVREVEDELGPISTLVNNAGVHQKKAAIEITDEEYDSVLQVNTKAVFAMSREVARGMTARGGGSIQVISSASAVMGIPLVASYTTSKAAVTGLVRQLSVEWGPFGVRVNAIIPGFIATDMSRNALEKDPSRKRKVLGRTPLGRLGEPREIGNVSTFLASPAASFVTGIAMEVDGGATIGF